MILRPSAAYLLCIDPDKQHVLLVEVCRDNGETVWVMPGGPARPGEMLEEALFREVHSTLGRKLHPDTARLTAFIGHTLNTNQEITSTVFVGHLDDECGEPEVDSRIVRVHFWPLSSACNLKGSEGLRNVLLLAATHGLIS